MKLNLPFADEQYKTGLCDEVYRLRLSISESIINKIDSELHYVIPKSIQVNVPRPIYYVSTIMNLCGEYVNNDVDFDAVLPGFYDAIDNFYKQAFLELPQTDKLLLYADYLTQKGDFEDFDNYYDYSVGLGLYDCIRGFLSSEDEDEDFDNWIKANYKYFNSFIQPYLLPRKL